MTTLRLCMRIAAASIGMCLVSLAFGQTFPSRPITVIIPFAAGGSVDAVVRALGPLVTESTGQPVLVENRPGGSSIIGMLACAKATPDGHTICVTTADSLSFNPALFSDLPYNPETDFVPIMNLGMTTGSLVAHVGAPFNTYKEMISYAKSNPGKLNWATWGPASRPDLYLRWIRNQEGVDILAIPYKGAGQGNPAVLSGETHITYMGVGLASEQVKAGKLKALVTLDDRSSRLMPGVPTLGSQGSDPQLPSYFGAFAPGRTPRMIVERLNAELAKATRAPRMQELYRSLTMESIDNSAADFAEFARKDRENAAKVMRSIGIKPSAAPSS
jgi:tripartite-type tricarboxylate transporter receptor subunit TctC